MFCSCSCSCSYRQAFIILCGWSANPNIIFVVRHGSQFKLITFTSNLLMQPLYTFRWRVFGLCYVGALYLSITAAVKPFIYLVILFHNFTMKQRLVTAWKYLLMPIQPQTDLFKHLINFDSIICYKISKLYRRLFLGLIIFFFERKIKYYYILNDIVHFYFRFSRLNMSEINTR